MNKNIKKIINNIKYYKNLINNNNNKINNKA